MDKERITRGRSVTTSQLYLKYQIKCCVLLFLINEKWCSRVLNECDYSIIIKLVEGSHGSNRNSLKKEYNNEM